MSTTVQRSSRSGGKSLFFHDLATPVSAHRGKFTSPGQAAAVSALWRENFGGADPPPPPVFTLEDRVDFSPESAIADYNVSSESKSEMKTPVRYSLTPTKSRYERSGSYSAVGGQQTQQSPANSSWWSTGRSGGEHEEKGKGSPVEGVVQPGALITLPPPREVARPELQRNSLPAGNLDEEEWVTVYGSEGQVSYPLERIVSKESSTQLESNFHKNSVLYCSCVHSALIVRFTPGDTNLVLREFEKCGTILKHVPGPRNANWIHILYQNRFDAQKALNKNGMQINGVLIVGVKSLDPIQQQALNEGLNSQGFMPLQPSSSRRSELNPSRASTRPYYLQNGNISQHSPGVIASPAKSVVSKIVDLMFGI